MQDQKLYILAWVAFGLLNLVRPSSPSFRLTGNLSPFNSDMMMNDVHLCERRVVLLFFYSHNTKRDFVKPGILCSSGAFCNRVSYCVCAFTNLIQTDILPYMIPISTLSIMQSRSPVRCAIWWRAFPQDIPAPGRPSTDKGHSIHTAASSDVLLN